MVLAEPETDAERLREAMTEGVAEEGVHFDSGWRAAAGYRGPGSCRASTCQPTIATGGV